MPRVELHWHVTWHLHALRLLSMPKLFVSIKGEYVSMHPIIHFFSKTMPLVVNNCHDVGNSFHLLSSMLAPRTSFLLLVEQLTSHHPHLFHLLLLLPSNFPIFAYSVVESCQDHPSDDVSDVVAAVPIDLS